MPSFYENLLRQDLSWLGYLRSDASPVFQFAFFCPFRRQNFGYTPFSSLKGTDLSQGMVIARFRYLLPRPYSSAGVLRPLLPVFGIGIFRVGVYFGFRVVASLLYSPFVTSLLFPSLFFSFSRYLFRRSMELDSSAFFSLSSFAALCIVMTDAFLLSPLSPIPCRAVLCLMYQQLHYLFPGSVLP